jgi:hypothetical protein
MPPCEGLFSEIEADDQVLIPLSVSRIEIVEQFSPLAYELKES